MDVQHMHAVRQPIAPAGISPAGPVTASQKQWTERMRTAGARMTRCRCPPLARGLRSRVDRGIHGLTAWSGGSGGNSQHPFWAHLTLTLTEVMANAPQAMGNGEDADALATALTVCASVWAEVLGIPPPEPTDGERLPTM